MSHQYGKAPTQEEEEQFVPMQPSGYRDGDDAGRYHRKTYTEKSFKNRMQKNFWLAKQTMIEKLGKEQDEHVVASDLELDQTLEAICIIEQFQIYKQLSVTSTQLLKAVERYQNALRELSSDEGELARFIQEHGANDKTRAGKMMRVVGKSLGFTGQQRLLVRGSLVRLLQEVGTFRQRALSDCALTIQRMQTARTEYRAALLWLKDASQDLDPDVNKRLDKFRKIQTIVKRSHEKFRSLKFDACQKIELLNASRANLFSQTLAPYQQQIMKFWKISNRSMSGIADSFRGYQHYEYRVLKELQEPLPEDLNENDEDRLGEIQEDDQNLPGKEEAQGENDEALNRNVDEMSANMASLISFDENRNTEYQYDTELPDSRSDDDPLIGTEEIPSAYIDMLSAQETSMQQSATQEMLTGDGNLYDPNLQQLAPIAGDNQQQFYDTSDGQQYESQDGGNDVNLLNDILNSPPVEGAVPSSENEASMNDFQKQWQTVFGSTEANPQSEYSSELTNLLGSQTSGTTSWMPSNLLDESTTPGDNLMTPIQNMSSAPSSDKPSSKATGKKSNVAKGDSSKLASWFNLFADLDPLSNPDSIGVKKDEVEERNC
ncbi:Islet cell autoantigen 1 [Trichoplax sp. H2]|nr:Islet cell autoantigen 1 [Trichoplax sp. H2]|eukprot:RDD45155.1 Islet cell autoantigen 1 [Trichoplax sp. H2]